MPSEFEREQERGRREILAQTDRYSSQLLDLARAAGERDARWQTYLADYDYQQKLHFEKVRQQDAIAQITERGEQTRETHAEQFRLSEQAAQEKQGRERARLGTVATQLGLSSEIPWDDMSEITAFVSVRAAQQKLEAGEAAEKVLERVLADMPEERKDTWGDVLTLAASSTPSFFSNQLKSYEATLQNQRQEKQRAAISGALAEGVPEEYQAAMGTMTPTGALDTRLKLQKEGRMAETSRRAAVRQLVAVYRKNPWVFRENKGRGAPLPVHKWLMDYLAIDDKEAREIVQESYGVGKWDISQMREQARQEQRVREELEKRARAGQAEAQRQLEELGMEVREEK